MPNEALQETAETDTANTTAETTEAREQGGAGAEQPSDAETRARRMGWHPKEEYDASGRDPAKWVEADVFLQRGENELPVLRERFRKMERLTEKQGKQLEEGNKLLRDMVQHQGERERKAVERAIKDLETKRDAAAADGNVAEVRTLSNEIIEQRDALKTPAAAERQNTDQGKPPVPEEVIEWVEENPWFNSDRTMNAFATAQFGEFMADKSLSDTQRLAKVKAEVVKRFPEKFGNPRRQQAAAVEGGNGGSGRRTTSKGWNDLPREAQEIGERLVRQKVLPNKDAYLKSYAW